jgi:hypothetical protein
VNLKALEDQVISLSKVGQDLRKTKASKESIAEAEKTHEELAKIRDVLKAAVAEKASQPASAAKASSSSSSSSSKAVCSSDIMVVIPSCCSV